MLQHDVKRQFAALNWWRMMALVTMKVAKRG
ncbi:hypothetical protein J2X10_002289 [Pseudomonas peli]|jgi:hypothetical protein|nr:hypothetical protein [Pseudomonas peli]